MGGWAGGTHGSAGGLRRAPHAWPRTSVALIHPPTHLVALAHHVLGHVVHEECQHQLRGAHGGGGAVWAAAPPLLCSPAPAPPACLWHSASPPRHPTLPTTRLCHHHHQAHAPGHDGRHALAVGLARAESPPVEQREREAGVQQGLGGLGDGLLCVVRSGGPKGGRGGTSRASVPTTPPAPPLAPPLYPSPAPPPHHPPAVKRGMNCQAVRSSMVTSCAAAATLSARRTTTMRW